MPSNQPSVEPSAAPSAHPSALPSEVPTLAPSASPSGLPSNLPSAVPTRAPSGSPTRTAQPSSFPSVNPTVKPSVSVSPSLRPSVAPSKQPSQKPSASPSKQPSPSPIGSTAGTPAPTNEPVILPTCFSGVNTVEVRGRGEIPIETLRIGDEVRDGHESFSRVYSLGHKDRTSRVEYLQIFSDLDKPLEVTRWHYVIANSVIVFANDVKVGDVVSGNHTVTKIRSILRRGKYAPLTESGYIEVSGVVASNYAILLRIPPWILHPIFHALLAPFRLVCTVNFGVCAGETYTNGDSDWGYYTRPMLAAFSTLGSPLQVLTLIAIAPVVVALTYPSLALALAGMLLLRAAKKRQKGKIA